MFENNLQSLIISLQDGKSPLHWAVLQENVEIVKNLLSASQVPHPSLNEGDAAGNTPLHYSVMYGKKKVFKFLMSDDLASGLNIDKANHVSFRLHNSNATVKIISIQLQCNII